MSVLVPGRLYKMSPRHEQFRGNEHLTFLCTKAMYASYRPNAEAKDCALITISDGGLWDNKPSTRPDAFVDVTDELLEKCNARN